jgi:N-acetylglucosamine kinase-like BadF-type ATPase
MTLIADGGSTKCDWVLLDNKGNQLFKTRTLGLNPAVVPEEELIVRIKDNQDLQQVFDTVEVVDFYGAGCGTKTPKAILHKILTGLFPIAKVEVAEDMVAAALAVTDQPGIVCIFGTGSNSCFFDGKTTKTNVDSLGYILMDEASGNYFGKRLIRDYFYKKMPAQIALDFEKRFDLNPDVIKTNLYKKT